MWKEMFCDLSSISDNKLAWGNKAINLSKLIGVGLPVPRGFVINSSVFQQYKDLKYSVEFDSFIKVLEQQLIDQINRFNIDKHALIFRSSADIEGIVSASFCGIFDSYKYEDGQNLSKPLLSVWESSFSCAADCYCSTIGMERDVIHMAVIVQSFFDGTIFGTIQTRDIIKGSDSFVIEYTSECYDSVVSGRDNPSMLVISRSGDLMFEECFIKLSKMQKDLLFNIAKSVENVFSFPVEIEFSLNRNDIVILQARILS